MPPKKKGGFQKKKSSDAEIIAEALGNGIIRNTRTIGNGRIGPEYQADIQPLIPESEQNKEADLHRATQLWGPTENISDAQLEDFLVTAKIHDYTVEQAMGLLFWHKFDILKTLDDLPNFQPKKDDMWTVEEENLFEQAFQGHGKTISKIKLLFPEKSMRSIIHYYYRWKKTICTDYVCVQNKEERKPRIPPSITAIPGTSGESSSPSPITAENN